METTGNQNVDLNSQFGTIVATHPHLQLNRNSILSRPPSISFVVHPCPSFARFCESRISSIDHWSGVEHWNGITLSKRPCSNCQFCDHVDKKTTMPQLRLLIVQTSPNVAHLKIQARPHREIIEPLPSPT